MILEFLDMSMTPETNYFLSPETLGHFKLFKNIPNQLKTYFLINLIFWWSIIMFFFGKDGLESEDPFNKVLEILNMGSVSSRKHKVVFLLWWDQYLPKSTLNEFLKRWETCKPRSQETKKPRRRNRSFKKLRNQGTNKIGHQENKKLRNHGIKKPRNLETKKPQNQETKELPIFNSGNPPTPQHTDWVRQ